MEELNRLYRKENYTIHKGVNVEQKLYNKLKYMSENEYDASISEIINICIEKFLEQEEIKYYHKPDEETTIYINFMLRIENKNALEKIKHKRGISITRLINIAVKEFIDGEK